MTNRYVIDGIIKDLSAGKHVHLVGHSMRTTRFQFGEVLRCIAPDDLREVRKSNGDERLETTTGGKVTVSTINGNGGRGVTPDSIVAFESLTWDADQMDKLLTLRAITEAEVIRA